MSSYLNKIIHADIDILKHEYCVFQPYLSGNYQVDLLLRNHKWAGGISPSKALTYRMITSSLEADSDLGDFWSGQGAPLFRVLSLLNAVRIEDDKAEYLPSYIFDGDNRDQYQLFENNFPSSFAQTEYKVSLYFENFKRKLIANPSHQALMEFSWMKSINSIYELNVTKINTSIISAKLLNPEILDFLDAVSSTLYSHYEFNSTMTGEDRKQAPSDLDISKFHFRTKYALQAISKVANISFTEVTDHEDMIILGQSYASDTTVLTDFLEEFDYSDDKTNHISLKGTYLVSNNTQPFAAMRVVDLLHGIGHSVLDHPNDANIAIRENLLPSDQNWGERQKDYGISNEYRADNGCMSVMSFTNCFYNGVKFHDALTYMPIDIQALQHLYGKNQETGAGDTKYIVTENQTFTDSLENPMFPMDIPSKAYDNKNSIVNQNRGEVPAPSIYTLYDAGGINTIDLSLVKKAKIDLNEGAGHFNVIENNIFLIAYDTLIHNIIVGSGNITIKLNSLSNVIEVPSNGAHVTIDGFANNDSLILDNNDYELEYIGCIKPYAVTGDNITEICFI